ncbi:MAG: hypothetical protein B6I38_01810 [Anaerolineaceae bacterium 4572_5.1]|nr:MAG: hypothetical protein B6I38_01810 [Anaerolineaceae bacterium 4572_5.1]
MSTLFDVLWDDRSVFEAGLLDDQEDILNRLDGASVYHLELNIDPDMTHLAGREEVRYTNTEDAPLTEIYFHLFPNILDGSSKVTNLRVNNRPVEGQLSNRNSALQVPLAAPLKVGESVVVTLDFSVKVPTEAGATYGAFSCLDNILALPHAYPMIAVYDDEGWNIEVPPTYGDVVYADTSFYLARVIAPSDLTIIASGVEIETEEDAGTQTVTFAAGPMRDFYLAASNDYVVTSQIVDGTLINSYAPPDVSDSAEQALEYVVDAVNTFNYRVGPYPFTELDLLATPTTAGGIEYPGAIVVALSLYQNPNDFFELATAHETAHQWFYSAVGSDQVDDPWLDESLTQYATWMYFREVYGEQGGAQFERQMNDFWRGASDTNIPIGLPVAAYSDSDYGSIVYGKGPIFFNTLAETMGEDAFDAFLRDYYQSYRWGISTPEALKTLAEEHCGCNLTPLFEEWVFGEG